MADVKQPTTIDEQITKLESRGCIIEDRKFSEFVLSNINYYRLTAYFLPFRQEDESYVNGTSFNKIYNLYEFDRKLRNVLYSAIEVIEISLRTRLSYYHATKYGPLGYLDPANFNSRHDSAKFITNINREIDNNEKVLFVKHHIENYDRQFPLWVVSELFTFGMLSRFYNDLFTSDKKILFGTEFADAVSWLRCCTDVRNICAHYGRLYYRVFTASPKGFNLSSAAKSRLWGAVLSIKALYPSDEKWNTEFLPRIEAIFDEYASFIDLYHLAFPKDWKKQLRK